MIKENYISKCYYGTMQDAILWWYILTTYILKSYQEQLPSAKMMFIEIEVLKCSKSLCLLFYLQQQHQMVFRLE